jgi:hypothetical protein
MYQNFIILGRMCGFGSNTLTFARAPLEKQKERNKWQLKNLTWMD